jgi:hypothetical protein
MGFCMGDRNPLVGGLVKLDQDFKQVAADEASHAGNEPCFWLGLQAGLELGKWGHFAFNLIASYAYETVARD